MRIRLVIPVLALATALGGGALVASGAGATTASKGKGKTQAVPVKLLEFQVKAKRASVSAERPVKFKVKNIGTEEHEMVVARTDGSALPTKDDGSVDEDAIPESDLFGEVEGLQPKKSGTLKIKDLPPGEYVLFCNIVDDEPDGTTLSHYAQGMYTDFSVE
jgi:uncharacterized cupredoxin-like copper-binding protein